MILATITDTVSRHGLTVSAAAVIHVAHLVWPKLQESWERRAPKNGGILVATFGFLFGKNKDLQAPAEVVKAASTEIKTS